MTRPVDFKSENWRRLRKRILNRDNKKCYVCEKPDDYDLTVHHIIPRRQGGKSEPRNLITLCTSCHYKAEESSDTWVWIQENRKEQKSSTKFNDNMPMPNVELKPDQHISRDSLGRWRIWGRDHLGVYSIELGHMKTSFVETEKTPPTKSTT